MKERSWEILKGYYYGSTAMSQASVMAVQLPGKKGKE